MVKSTFILLWFFCFDAASLYAESNSRCSTSQNETQKIFSHIHERLPLITNGPLLPPRPSPFWIGRWTQAEIHFQDLAKIESATKPAISESERRNRGEVLKEIAQNLLSYDLQTRGKLRKRRTVDEIAQAKEEVTQNTTLVSSEKMRQLIALCDELFQTVVDENSITFDSERFLLSYSKQLHLPPEDFFRFLKSFETRQESIRRLIEAKEIEILDMKRWMETLTSAERTPVEKLADALFYRLEMANDRIAEGDAWLRKLEEAQNIQH